MQKLEQALDKSLYGQGTAKTWQSLINEIQSGDCQIVWEGDRPIREVSVLRIEVIASEDSDYPGLFLQESYQEFSDGRRRERNLSGLSEKIKPGEDLDKAVVRALEEELGIDATLVAIQIDPCQDTEEKESPSYPGLTTRYVLFEATAILDAELVKPQYVEVQEDKKTVFEWR